MKGKPTFGRHLRRLPTLAEIFEVVSPEPNSGCWLWLGPVDAHGYARASAEGQTWRVHRLVYELTRGPLSPGLVACHHCDTPGCVNPDHVFAGTPADNNHDKIRNGRDVIPWLNGGGKDRSWCQRGLHEVRGWNAMPRADGNTQCRLCKNTNDRERRRRIARSAGTPNRSERPLSPLGSPPLRETA